MPSEIAGPDVPDLGSPPATVGTFCKSNSPQVAEALALTDLDFVVVDRQHASPTLETVENIVRAAAVHDTPVLVRLPDRGTSLVGNLLDAGVAGLIVPTVETPAEIERVVEAGRYGDDRSFALSTRSGSYGRADAADHVETADERIAFVPMIESVRGLDNAEEIAAVDGVDALMIGPADLRLSMGVDAGSPDLERAIEAIETAAAAAGCGVGRYVGSPAEIERRHDEVGFLIYSSDIGAIAGHYDLDELR